MDCFFVNTLILYLLTIDAYPCQGKLNSNKKRVFCLSILSGNAGGFMLDGFGAALIEGLEGDPLTVVGLPLHRFCDVLTRILDVLLPAERHNA